METIVKPPFPERARAAGRDYAAFLRVFRQHVYYGLWIVSFILIGATAAMNPWGLEWEMLTDPIPTVLTETGRNLAAPVRHTELKADSIRAFIARWKPTAQAEYAEFGVLPSITMGQAIIESRAGTSFLADTARNFFGVKCFEKNCKAGHCVRLFDDAPTDRFVVYASAWHSFRAHSKFLARDRYKSCFRQGTDWQAWAHSVKKAGYATDPKYAEKLIAVIKRWELWKLDPQSAAEITVKKKTNIKI
jgi:flagellum-specific peptidoglycan hydrolase FlgJ